MGETDQTNTCVVVVVYIDRGRWAEPNVDPKWKLQDTEAVWGEPGVPAAAAAAR